MFILISVILTPICLHHRGKIEGENSYFTRLLGRTFEVGKVFMFNPSILRSIFPRIVFLFVPLKFQIGNNDF